jgi:hypothetical protein
MYLQDFKKIRIYFLTLKKAGTHRLGPSWWLLGSIRNTDPSLSVFCPGMWLLSSREVPDITPEI